MSDEEKLHESIVKRSNEAHDALFKKSNEALDLLANAEHKATERLSTAEQRAMKRLESAAAAAEKVRNAKEGNDHDLLITLKTKLDRVLDDLQEIKGINEKRISAVEADIRALELNKLNKTEFNVLEDEVHGKIEDRVRSSENKFSGIWITISIYSLAIVGLFGIILNHIAAIPK